MLFFGLIGVIMTSETEWSEARIRVNDSVAGVNEAIRAVARQIM